MEANLNVNISLPPSELDILKKMAKALGWNLFVQQEDDRTDRLKRQEIVQKLYGCIQLPNEFDYKKELEQAVSERYKV